MPESPEALLLIGHGTRSSEGAEEFHQLASLVPQAFRSAGLAEPTLSWGFLEFSQPDIDSAVDALCDRGITKVVAVPVILLAAGHLKIDGPSVLRRARQRHPHVEFTYARDLGINPTILAITQETIATTLTRLGVNSTGAMRTRHRVEEDGAAAILVGRGSSDPDANSDLFKAARLLSDRRGLPLVEPAFVSLSPPSVTDALDRVALLGARHIAVVPYFLFSGVLSERIARQAHNWLALHPEVTLSCAGAMGPDARIADLLVERFQEACVGHVAMNCDHCIYRSALPGYEERFAAS